MSSASDTAREQHWRRVVLFASAAALVALFGATQWIRSGEPLGLDQGLFACFTEWVPEGWVPYRDLYDTKPPLFLYAFGLAGIFPGSAAAEIWWFEGMWLASILVAAFFLGRRLSGAWCGLAAAALLFVGLWCPAWGGYWSRAQAEELLALPMLGVGLVVLGRAPTRRTALLAGVLTGVCGLFKIPAMAIGAACLAAWMGDGRRAFARRTGWTALGAAIPWLVAAVWFLALGALGDFVAAVFVHQGNYAAYIAPAWTDVLSAFATHLASAVPELLVGSALGLWAMARRDPRAFRVVATWLAATCAAVVLQRQLAGYHFMLAVPALAVASAYGVAAAGRWVTSPGSRRWIAAAALVAMSALLVRTGARWADAYGDGLTYVRARLARPIYLKRLSHGGGRRVTEQRLAAYVWGNTEPGDRILIWGMAPAVYAMAERAPATRYVFHKLLLTDAPLSMMIPGLEERRAAFLEGLRRDPPSLILVGTRDRNSFEAEDSLTSLRRFDALASFVDDHYARRHQIGTWIVMGLAASVEPSERGAP